MTDTGADPVADAGDFAARFAPADGIYLLSHSVGRPPADAPQQLGQAFFKPWEVGRGEPWPQWLQAIEAFRGALAELLHARPEDFCPQANLSSALTKVIQSLPEPGRRNRLLLSEEDFPSMGFVASQASRGGYEPLFIPRDKNAAESETWRSYLDDRVALALITQVQSNSGRRLPVREVLALAHERGALSVVDVAQSAGVIPIDLGAWEADFVIGSCVKWLCGGPGAGWLWAHPDRVAECRPTDVGWFSHEDPFEFDIRAFRYHPGALRFWGGTPSVLPYALAAHSLRVIAGIGVDTVHRHNRALTQMLIDGLPAGRLRSPSAADARGGTVVVAPGPVPERVLGALDAASVRYDRRATGIRLSPHVYNTRAEIDTVLRCF